jgi:hypothetical protein
MSDRGHVPERTPADMSVVEAFLGGREATAADLEVEVRPGRHTTDPRSGAPLVGASIPVLWAGEQPAAAIIGGVVLVNRSCRRLGIRDHVAERARELRREIQEVTEPRLWRLLR